MTSQWLHSHPVLLPFGRVCLRKEPFITEAQRQKRISFGEKYKDQTIGKSKRVWCRDESTFQAINPSAQNNSWMTRYPTATSTFTEILSLMVYGAFEFNGPVKLVILPHWQTVTNRPIISFLVNTLNPNLRKSDLRFWSDTTHLILRNILNSSLVIVQKTGLMTDQATTLTKLFKPKHLHNLAKSVLRRLQLFFYWRSSPVKYHSWHCRVFSSYYPQSFLNIH